MMRMPSAIPIAMKILLALLLFLENAGAGFQPHFHLAQSKDLTWFQHRFGDLFAVDEGAVGGVEIFDQKLGAAAG